MAETIPSVGDLIAGREPDAEEQAIVEYVLSLAHDWDAGLINLEDVRRMSTGPERAKCARFCCYRASAFPTLWRMFDALVDTERWNDSECSYRTGQGVFTSDEIRGIPVKFRRTEEGRMYPVFVG